MNVLLEGTNSQKDDKHIQNVKLSNDWLISRAPNEQMKPKAFERPLTKPGSDSGSDRIGLVSSLLVQNYCFEKSCLTMTQVARKKK